MMTESEAWQHLATLWSRAAKSYKNVGIVGGHVAVENSFVLIADQKCYGLCISIYMLAKHEITEETRMSMSSKIPNDGIHFLFPTTCEGATQRAEFCLQHAKELE